MGPDERMQHDRGAALAVAVGVFLVALGFVMLLLLSTGCRTGQLCKIANYGTLNYTQTVKDSGTINSKEFPFDIGRGAKVTAIP